MSRVIPEFKVNPREKNRRVETGSRVLLIIMHSICMGVSLYDWQSRVQRRTKKSSTDLTYPTSQPKLCSMTYNDVRRHIPRLSCHITYLLIKREHLARRYQRSIHQPRCHRNIGISPRD